MKFGAPYILSGAAGVILMAAFGLNVLGGPREFAGVPEEAPPAGGATAVPPDTPVPQPEDSVFAPVREQVVAASVEIETMGMEEAAAPPAAEAAPAESLAMASPPPSSQARAVVPVMPMSGAWPAGWRQYRDRFIENGRVKDTANNNVSHSEGQGFGMLLAVANDDPETFARLWGWTRRNLGLRADGLFSWRYDPSADKPVEDGNAAADGDLIIAWALARAGERWNNLDYRLAADEIARNIRQHLVREIGGHLVLLPAPEGFEREDDGTVLNLSYWVFPALRDLARLDGDPAWDRLSESGVALLKDARFGPRKLASDWVVLHPDGRLEPAGGDLGNDFGYNGVRIPLYLAWAGLGDADTMEPFRELWLGRRGRQPDWPPPMVVDVTDGSVKERMTDPAFWRIAGLSGCLGGPADPGLLYAGQGLSEQYYAASLSLMVDIVLRGRSGLCRS
jgi:endoglucanase